jgi:hypothetical protein
LVAGDSDPLTDHRIELCKATFGSSIANSCHRLTIISVDVLIFDY